MSAKQTSPAVELEVDGRAVRISSPDRVYFSARGETKLDLANYYLSVGDGIVRALYERPCMLHRFPKGVDDKKVHQKRVPAGAPPWIETVRLHFPRWNRTADELCVTEPAQVAWAVQMSMKTPLSNRLLSARGSLVSPWYNKIAIYIVLLVSWY